MPAHQQQSRKPALIFDQHLIRQYDSRGPRYTSYPTALQFVGFDAETYQACLQKLDDSEQAISLYIHIPFCRDICHYCACNKVVTRDVSQAETYIQYLKKEVRLVSQSLTKRKVVKQLHFGGGTPTFLNSGQLTELIFYLSSYFELLDSDDREYSIEIDPRTVDKDSLALLKGLGFNRLSFGVQDFDSDVQQAVNRVNSYADVKALVNAAKNFGFRSINVDLIYGLPKQTLTTLSDTLDKVVSLDIDRIAFYNYAHLPERFKSQRAIDRLQLPSAEQKLQFLQLIGEKLSQADYLYIGLDHFVKPQDSLALAQQAGLLQRNFQGYSTSHSPFLIALGMSSISNGVDYFAQNYKRLEQYYAALDENRLPIEKGLLVSADDSKRRAVIMAIICNLRLDIVEWEQCYHESFWHYFSTARPELERMQDDGLLFLQEQSIEVSSAGRAMLRNICLIFDAYAKADTPKLSKIL